MIWTIEPLRITNYSNLFKLYWSLQISLDNHQNIDGNFYVKKQTAYFEHRVTKTLLQKKFSS